MQLFSTVSVQYVSAWSKEMVALLRKVSARPAQSAGRPDMEGVWGGTGSPEHEWAGLGGWGGQPGEAGWTQGANSCILGRVSISALAARLAWPRAPHLVAARPV